MKRQWNGFTLFEMLLVLVIITTILLMMMGYMTSRMDESRRDRAVLQMEQVLNAGMAYYINYSNWPASMTDLQTNNYLPNKGTIYNPWGSSYNLSSNQTTGTFSACATVNSKTEAELIASRLPMAYVANGQSTSPCPAPSDCTGDNCTVVSTVNIPGQNLNNARSVNFAGLYHNGACVPVPTCPQDMEPAIIAAPVSVTGNYDGTTDVYPLSSFTAYAKAKGNPPANCTGSASAPSCTPGSGGSINNSPTSQYWRVCLSVVTEKGEISTANNAKWNVNSGTIMAITRCVPKDEPVGSDFTVFQNY